MHLVLWVERGESKAKICKSNWLYLDDEWPAVDGVTVVADVVDFVLPVVVNRAVVDVIGIGVVVISVVVVMTFAVVVVVAAVVVLVIGALVVVVVVVMGATVVGISVVSISCGLVYRGDDGGARTVDDGNVNTGSRSFLIVFRIFVVVVAIFVVGFIHNTRQIQLNESITENENFCLIY